MSSWFVWTGGGGASSRLALPVVFVLAAAAAAAYKAAKGKAAGIIIKILFGWGVLMSLSIMAVPWFRWNRGAGDGWVLKIISGKTGLDFTALFPSFAAPDNALIIQVISWIIIAAAVNIYIYKSGK